MARHTVSKGVAAGLGLLGLLMPAPAPAGPAGSGLAGQFAICAGRYSAFVDWSYLLPPGPALTRLHEARRAALTALQEAAADPRDARRLLALRIEAKQAQAHLLHRSRFNSDPEDARRAAALAQRQLTACAALLLP
ncbi:hypothetical protein KM176_01735 [Pseudooceanicola sp. CBS1P-1]|uniref:Uncharacterized protein n=1 Tax=Pseudooceanicola albus TaxID=2692189 RepID=A0A6L7FZM1_9RHOB|nr:MULTISPECIES: hypothetical protein [Pseudooceanicola]MBT9382568.1 hypothetical protein [Pseudooceanicola endophyticus]MXN17109.1 hypothetical protein [Pseudooceanicola albus]